MSWEEKKLKADYAFRLEHSAPGYTRISEAPSFAELTARCKTNAEERAVVEPESKKLYTSTDGRAVYLIRNEPAIGLWQSRQGATRITRQKKIFHCALLSDEEIRKQLKGRAEKPTRELGWEP